LRPNGIKKNMDVGPPLKNYIRLYETEGDKIRQVRSSIPAAMGGEESKREHENKHRGRNGKKTKSPRRGAERSKKNKKRKPRRQGGGGLQEKTGAKAILKAMKGTSSERREGGDVVGIEEGRKKEKRQGRGKVCAKIAGPSKAKKKDSGLQSWSLMDFGIRPRGRVKGENRKERTSHAKKKVLPGGHALLGKKGSKIGKGGRSPKTDKVLVSEAPAVIKEGELVQGYTDKDTEKVCTPQRKMAKARDSQFPEK